ncbi:SDR family NAD(P)-dependent oxidoreductase [Microbacterium sp. CFH 90308]|uniref:SDR family NAD(P)-dependent oxidoreductase n=1 Tax=Microbacterium salsuginis TaxID=2722803 RepID=A0ABX1KEJ1_9MICO|nr:SDR family NAD(P)-dependent oxidoreductase [Microbacterium sp. CFH 90308]NLP84540.1 SDR family NAD(P)-dependent oxidoreductase [Microbacterium sp. CFH 90308]
MSTIALITGGNRGLGLATATALAQSGATVIIAGRDLNAVRTAADGLVGQGLRAEALAMDVTSTESIAAAAATVAARHGRLDVLVNNAGVLPEATSSSDHHFVDVDAFRTTFETNVFGVAATTEGFLPLLMQSDAGRIVNVSSTMGSLNDQQNVDSPFYSTVVPAYQASKAAVNSITIGLSKKLAGTKLKVTSVCPGWVQTDLAPGNREHAPTTADDAARIVLTAAMLPDDAPSGTFIDDSGPVPW